MMTWADFSEFSYGYAVTESVMRGRLGTAVGYPVLPALNEEGAPEGGYDVGIGPPAGKLLMLQFKRPQVISRRSFRMPEGFHTPYMRMHLMPPWKSDQHDMLIQHEANGHLVRYVAPRFWLHHQFVRAYVERQVLQRSLFIRPTDIGQLPEDRQVCVAYHGTVAGVWRNPDLHLLTESDSFHNLQRDVAEALREPLPLHDALLKPLGSLLRIAHDRHPEIELPRVIEATQAVSGLAETVAYIARTFFDCEPLLIAPRAKEIASGKAD